MNNYDWRKGRELVEIPNRDSWAKRKIQEKNPGKEISDDDIEEFLSTHTVTWANTLEATPEEVTSWKQFYRGIEEKKEPLGQTLAYISHPKLGRLYALETRIRTDILERENVWFIDDSLMDVREDSDMFDRWQKQNVILKKFADRILKGNIPTREELFGNSLTYKVKGMRGQKKEESSNYANLLWHWMVQFSDGDKLPYLPFIPEGEARQAIGAYLEEKLDTYRKLKSEGK